MRLEYELTKQDMIAMIAFKLKEKKERGLKSLAVLESIFLSSALWVLIICIGELSPPAGILIWIILFIGCLVYFLIFNSCRQRAKRIVNKQIYQKKLDVKYFGHHIMTVEEDCLRHQYDTFEGIWNYAGISQIQEYECGILIHHNKESVDVIPSSAFHSLEDRVSFLNLLQSSITQKNLKEIPEEYLHGRWEEADFALKYTCSRAQLEYGLAKANQWLMKTRLGWSSFLVVRTFVGLCILILTVRRIFLSIPLYFSEGYSGGPIVLGTILTMIFLFPIIAVVFTPHNIKSSWKKQTDGSFRRNEIESRALLFLPDCITEITSNASIDIMYDKLASVKQDLWGMYLLFYGKRVILIPDEAFDSQDRKEEIGTYLIEKIGKSK